MTEETVRAPTPKITLDRMRGFGQVCPPETLLCAGGRSIPAALRDDNPSEFQLFHNRALTEKTAVVPKTRCYEQDGFSFDADGLLIEETLDEQALRRAQRAEAERRARLAARKAHAEAMRAEGFPEGSFVDIEPMPVVTASDVGKPGEGPKIDLIAWAKGHAHVPFFAVKKAFRDQHGFDIADRESGVTFLVDNKLILPSAVG